MGMWNTFENRIVVEADLVCRTGLRIGCGGEAAQPTATDLPVIVDEAGRPFIPGSSLRGVVRSHIERIVRSLEPRTFPQQNAASGRGACNPVVESEWCVTSGRVRQLRDMAKEDDTGNRRNVDARFAENLWNESCRVCRVFGSPWLASRVRFADLPSQGEVHVELRDGVAINRDKETVQNKYDFEVVPAGSRFRFQLTLENVEPAERGLIWIGIRELQSGNISLGGFKGRGLGQVTLENTRTKWVNFADRKSDTIRHFLLRGEMTDCSDEEIESWIQAFWDDVELGRVSHA